MPLRNEIGIPIVVYICIHIYYKEIVQYNKTPFHIIQNL